MTGKRVYLLLILLAFAIALISNAFGSKAATVAKEQFEAIQNHQLTEAYYAHTTNDFRKVTSLEQFKTFVKNLPFKSENDPKLTLKTEETNSEFTQMEGTVTDKNGATTKIQYQLVDEDGEWKVQSMQVTEVTEGSAPLPKVDVPDFDIGAIQTPIQNMLSFFRKGEFKKAYLETTSKEFKEATSFPHLEEFIKGNPAFSNNLSVRFISLTFDGNIAEYNTELTSTDGTRKGALFYLLLDNKTWKIIQIQMLE